ncbi:MAG: capsular polysaccharide export protein, LipB/KpsS family [Alphaproteobacteria bacterium]
MIKSDNAVPPPFRAQVARNITVPLRALAAQNLLEKHYVRPQNLKGRYAFFPMHTEPEMQLLVYSRPYQDQVEAIRALAMALPPDMLLVVKEHPWMVGKRHLDAYRRILSIPRVRLSAPEVDTLTYSKNADLIVTLGSSVGLDAALMGTPVVTMGGCLFNALPRHLVREVRDLSQLPQEIRDLLKNFKPDDRALEFFVSAVMTHGVPVNFYSTLLGRPGVNKVTESDFETDSDRLAAAVADILKRIPENPDILPGGASW